VTSDFDLSSLIEGVVDEDSEDGGGGAAEDDNKNNTPVFLYREPLKVSTETREYKCISGIKVPTLFGQFWRDRLRDVCNHKMKP
jgi:hypothetical protein